MFGFGPILEVEGLFFLLDLRSGALSSLTEEILLGEALDLASGESSDLNGKERLGELAAAFPLVFSLIFLFAKPALAGLSFLGRFIASVSILRGLSVTGERLNQDSATCEKRIKGEDLTLEGVLGLDEEPALICATGDMLGGVMIHDRREVKEDGIVGRKNVDWWITACVGWNKLSGAVRKEASGRFTTGVNGENVSAVGYKGE